MPANSKANHLLPQSRDESTNGEQPEITETQCRIRIVRNFIIWFLGEDCFCVFLFCPIKRTHYSPLLSSDVTSGDCTATLTPFVILNIDSTFCVSLALLRD